MMRDGALWNALDSSFVTRSDTSVLRQKVRRQTVLQQPDNDSQTDSSLNACSIPEDWIQMKNIVSELGMGNEFARSAKRFRMLLASALSIFIFTFQGSIETALSTFDCKDVDGVMFLRLNPKIQCSYHDQVYPRMIIITAIGLAFYCLLLPCLTIIALRSRWCKDVYLHNSMAHSQIFGFLNSIYSQRCAMWELVACLRKLTFAMIPVLVSGKALAQSVCIFVFLIGYTFVVLKFQPMATASMNKIEVLSCISVIFGSFSSIFFVVEFNMQPVLSGASRDLVGIALVAICALCALITLQLILKDVRSESMLFMTIYGSSCSSCVNSKLFISTVFCRADAIA
jgi:hypothetical protein